MNSREYWGLSEAYAEVYIPQEESFDEGYKSPNKKRIQRQSDDAYKNERRALDRGDSDEAMKQNRRRNAMNTPSTRRNELESKNRKEEFDIFDNILEHLIDEGYADTEEAAIAIMANMSEEWRESILESGYFPTPESQRADEAKYKLRGQNVKPRTTQTQIGAKMKPTVNK